MTKHETATLNVKQALDYLLREHGLELSESTLRRYSDKGIVSVRRLPSGMRRWSPEALDKLGVPF